MNTPDKLYYYSKSKDVVAGKGKNEFVKDMDKYSELNKIKDWRKILSNFHEYPFTYENKKYNTVEHCFQSQKIKLVNNDIAYKFTLDSNDNIGKGTGEVARKNRKIVILTPEQLSYWDKMKDSIMKKICHSKYYQCNIYKTVIDNTNNAELWHIVSRSKFNLHTKYLEEIRDNV